MKYMKLLALNCLNVLFSVYFSLSAPCVPDVGLFGKVISDAFALAIVGYAISISLGKTFALKHGYKVDTNQVKLNFLYVVHHLNTFSILVVFFVNVSHCCRSCWR